MPEVIDIIIASIIYCSALALIFRWVVVKLFKGRDNLLGRIFPKYAAAGAEEAEAATAAAAVTEPELSAGESGEGLLPPEAAPLENEANEPDGPALPKESESETEQEQNAEKEDE